MTTKIETGGAAFPGKSYSGIPNEGMTLRDYFAGTSPKYSAEWFREYARAFGYKSEAITQAAWAYHYADAMLEARK